MRPLQSVPRIRVDLLDDSPRSLSPSSTLNIRDILSPVNAWPNLLAEDLVFDVAEDPLSLEDGRLQGVPSFPVGHKPPLFFLHSHRARLPFPIRQEAFEMGDFCRDEEDACPLLTAPTIPRMRLMIKEQLYMQKWVDTLTPDNPPKHIPWSCEKPTMERKWIAEGSIFPAESVKSGQRATTQEFSSVVDTDRLLAHTDHVHHSGELCVLSEASSTIHASTESPTSISHVPVKSADVDLGIRGESKISHTPYGIVRTFRASSPPALLPSGLPDETTLTTPDAPLAVRRGKSLGSLKLKASFIDQLEYPDIPTAFRGSSSVWSPRFDSFPVPFFTDHQSMLSNLKLKCAALGSGVSSCVPEYLHSQPETTCTPNEWMFARGLATFDDVLGSLDSEEVPKEIAADTSVFLPKDTSTPIKGSGFTARLGLPRLHSTPTLQSPVKRSSDPPGVPLPPRPALINPSTPPHVRGILKKVKSVRFEDMVNKELQETPPAVSRHLPERPSSQYLSVSARRPCTPMPNTAKPSGGLVPAKELPTLGRSAEDKKPAPRSRLPPKRVKASGKLEPNVGNPLERSEAATETIAIERPCRIVHAKKHTIPATVHQAQAKLKGTEADVRRGIEGTTKSRLSTPLRHIFRLR